MEVKQLGKCGGRDWMDLGWMSRTIVEWWDLWAKSMGQQHGLEVVNELVGEFGWLQKQCTEVRIKILIWIYRLIWMLTVIYIDSDIY